MWTQIKSFLRAERTFFAILLVLVGLIAYGLGLQAGAVTPVSDQPVIVFMAAEKVDGQAAQEVVASRSGTRYHRPDCSGAETIKEANLIRFASFELARSAGYLPAATCPNLQ